MKRLILLAALALTCLPALADNPNPPNPCGNHGNNCNPNPGGGGVGDVTNTNTNNINNKNVNANLSWNSNRNSNINRNSNSNQNTANGGAGGHGGQGGTGYGYGGTGGSATGGNATGGSSTSNSTANSSSNSGGNTLSVHQEGDAAAPDDITIRQAPGVFVGAAPATVSCYKTAAGGISGVLGGLSFSGGGIDANCEHRELARVTASIDPAAAIRVLCLSEMYQLANRSQCAGIPLVYLLNNRTRASMVQPTK